MVMLCKMTKFHELNKEDQQFYILTTDSCWHVVAELHMLVVRGKEHSQWQQTYLAGMIFGYEYVSCCQVSVYKGLAGEVGHTTGYVSTEYKELPWPRIIQSFSNTRRA